MAKDYFEDILPPHNGGKRPLAIKKVKQPEPVLQQEPLTEQPEEAPLAEEEEAVPPPERSIRNISVQRSRPRIDAGDVPPHMPGVMQRPPRRRSFRWLWAIVAIAAIVAAVLVLLAFRKTTVTVVPRTHTVAFDQTTQITAYPAATAASGTLAYTVQSIDLDDSEQVPSNGTVHADDKASGVVTVYNEYSDSPVKLIKNTRFSTPEGFIFRAPADIVVPGKSGTTAGKVQVTVIADQPGQQYNVGPTRLSLPGLKGTGDEYTKVYALSTTAMSGGFVGDKPGVAQGDFDKAVSLVRGRLEQKTQESVAALNKGSVMALVGRIVYQDPPPTEVAGGSARVHQKATAQIMTFDSNSFAKAVAQSVSADADNASVSLLTGKDFGMKLASASSTLGTDPLQFSLSGSSMIVWNVDGKSLAQALAGHERGAFETIVTGFPGIQSARARIEPFWSDVFPADPSAIRVTIQTPTVQ